MPQARTADSIIATCNTCMVETLTCNLIGAELFRWLLVAKGWRVKGEVLTCPACAAKRDRQ